MVILVTYLIALTLHFYLHSISAHAKFCLRKVKYEVKR
uniref:Uncharacterized protein n=1 Tax=Loigolactobacillus rennini TaxID=238013 RepID=A0A1K2I630_9LACO|nr:hypothetical protein LREN565_0319 [Loigolactobacillus rennini]